MFTFVTEGTLVRISPIEGVSQRKILITLWLRIRHECHHSVLLENSGELQIYDTMQKHFYWPHMASNVYDIVAKSTSCTRSSRTRKKNQKLRLFSQAGRLTFVTINILGSVPKTETVNNYIVVAIDCYSNQTAAVPTKKTTVPKNAKNFVEHWLSKLRIPFTAWTDDGLILFPNTWSHSAKNQSSKR